MPNDGMASPVPVGSDSPVPVGSGDDDGVVDEGELWISNLAKYGLLGCEKKSARLCEIQATIGCATSARAGRIVPRMQQESIVPHPNT